MGAASIAATSRRDRRRRVAPEQHPRPGLEHRARPGGLDDQAVEIGDDEVAVLAACRTTRCAGAAAAAPRRAGAAELRQEGHQARMLQHAAAERVGDGEVAGAHRLHHAGHAEQRPRAAPAGRRSSRRRGAARRRCAPAGPGCAARGRRRAPTGPRPAPACSRGSWPGRRARSRPRCSAPASAARPGPGRRLGASRSWRGAGCGRSRPADARGCRGTGSA
jgi:hypothetical protein